MDFIELKKQGQDTVSAPRLLNQYLCLLRSAYLIHQNSHWKCAGDNFYGNHLMFQRLYESAAERVDTVAEKVIGLFGNDALETESHPKIILTICSEFDSVPIENSLGIEKAICAFLESAYKEIKSKTNDMTLGLDDMIMSHASDSETAIYLLKQAKG